MERVTEPRLPEIDDDDTTEVPFYAHARNSHATAGVVDADETYDLPCTD